jgi:TolB-like protein
MLLLSALLFAQAVLPSEEVVRLRKGLIAVLEFQSKLAGAEKKTVDRQFLSDRVRNLVLKDLPEATVIDRENVVLLLRSQGKALEDCEGQCAVDTARSLGADLVVSGDVLRFGNKLALTLRLHASGTGRLLSTEQISAEGAAALNDTLPKAVHWLARPLLVARAATPLVATPPTPPRKAVAPTRRQTLAAPPGTLLPEPSATDVQRAQQRAAEMMRKAASAEARVNLEKCLKGKYPALCKHQLLTPEQSTEVKLAEHRENVRSCLKGKYRSLCRYADLNSEEAAAVHRAEKRENEKICLSGRYPSLCDRKLLAAP